MKLIRSPITWFVALLIIATFRNFCLIEMNAAPSKESEMWFAMSYCFIAACWVSRDSKEKGDLWPTDHVMVFCAVLFPAYLVTTRKWKGLVFIMALITALILTSILPSII